METSSCGIYGNVPRNEIHDMDREKVEMMVEIYESADAFRTQTDSNTNRQQLQFTGSESKWSRSPRSVLVCLVVLCVLLLTAVIVLCVLIYTNNHSCHINNKNITQKRNQLLTNNTKLTEERDKLLTNNTKLTEERNQLLTNNTKLTEERDQLLTNNTKLTEERNQLLTNNTKLIEEREAAKLVVFTDEWIYYRCSLYFISSESKSWSESRSYCRERGADLIIINNKEEQDFIDGITSKTKDHRIWIGLSDSKVEGRWKWVDGSTLTFSCYRFWRLKEPNGNREENCVESFLRWNDESCNAALKWICEKTI